MDKEREEIELYRDALHYLMDVLHAKFHNDDFIRQLIKGKNLHPFDKALRDVAKELL